MIGVMDMATTPEQGQPESPGDGGSAGGTRQDDRGNASGFRNAFYSGSAGAVTGAILPLLMAGGFLGFRGVLLIVFLGTGLGLIAALFAGLVGSWLGSKLQDSSYRSVVNGILGLVAFAVSAALAGYAVFQCLASASAAV